MLGEAPGANMRQEVYRVAYDEASAELSEILAKFEQMRLRKDRIEKVVEALKPLVSMSDIAGPSDRSAAPVERPVPAIEQAVPPVQGTPAPLPYPVQHPVQTTAEETNDPFNRRVDNAIGISSAAKDVREYSRLFNTGTSR